MLEKKTEIFISWTQQHAISLVSSFEKWVQLEPLSTITYFINPLRRSTIFKGRYVKIPILRYRTPQIYPKKAEKKLFINYSRRIQLQFATNKIKIDQL